MIFNLFFKRLKKLELIGADFIVPCHLSPEISAVDMEIRWFKETDCVCLYKNRQMFKRRGYKGRVNLFTEELDRGNVSLQLRDFRQSDVGDYLCQVINTERTEQITIRVGYVMGIGSVHHFK
uniref:Ig-like domain-containing protein n=1 Tax=Cyprinus carpio TaxID=7962 RepID=A0A8C2IZZ5_CYPCA